MGGAFLKKSEGGDNAEEQSTGAERKIVRDSLTQGDFLTADGLDEPADVAILITGGSDGKKGNNDYVAAFLRDFTEGLGHNGSGVVAASRPGAAEDDGVIARLRDSHDGQEGSQAKISTVDDINHVTGQVSAIRASADVITGKAGSYGIMDGATAAVAQ